MLEDQADEDEHDNDIGDETDQEDDKASSNEDPNGEDNGDTSEMKKKIKVNKTDTSELIEKPEHPDGYRAPKTKHDEPAPLDHLIELILGDRFPTQ